ncbi:hypothetical protein SAMN05444392_101564 [Seinonella peptonophila]|uniref:Calcineurin-like phosphoesterase domain-containing protein n=1 Tax=Seinonella peptonophila TaxID=112248 RepID=A0A1M4TNZ2_9BACL|nr:metallophosphoesterase [Seinonella peptonophila]SHE46191.1 hypothetical protein SAMN05444392_101564 [Seinonella peptonophila]
MAIFGLSDLHLSFRHKVNLYQIDPKQDIEKPMDIFDWNPRYFDLIRDHWVEHVGVSDTVLIPGDISWGLRLSEAVWDFDWIAQLPGNKVLSPGNHCYYAHSKKKVREALPEGMEWIDADWTLVEDYVVVATRGWNLPGDYSFQEQTDRKIYERQVGRLQLALTDARKHHPDRPIICMLHYPPLTKGCTESGFFQLLKEFSVRLCLFGHLHGSSAYDAIQGNIDEVQLCLVACDYLKFAPLDLTQWLYN